MPANPSVVARGVVPLLAFAALTAAMDVYGGNRLQHVTPESLAAVSFTFTAIFFIGIDVLRSGGASFRLLRHNRHDVVAINVTTAITWLATFYALRNLEPAVVNVVGLALAPVFTVLAGPLLRRNSTVIGMEVAVALGICGFLGVLVWGTFAGQTGIGEIGTGKATWGIVFSVVCAIGSSANIIYMKRLSDGGHSPQAVLAIRFLLMIVIGWLMTAVSGRDDIVDAVVPGLVVAIIGIGLPIYVLQIGIRHTEPITTSLLVSLSPLFAYLMQFLDGRLRPSTLTIVGILGIVTLAAVGTYSRNSHDRRTALPSVPSSV
ncbi:DMT family transporter [Micromonospora fulviviridis]|uniref:DMT family transporter n=1 Tax=Micromonospora fulviviridis TaxID=47860 RepID=A0ABV2VVQ0_9ACTN